MMMDFIVCNNVASVPLLVRAHRFRTLPKRAESYHSVFVKEMMRFGNKPWRNMQSVISDFGSGNKSSILRGQKLRF